MSKTFTTVINQVGRTISLISEKRGVKPVRVPAHGTADLGDEYTDGYHFRDLCKKRIFRVLRTTKTETKVAPPSEPAPAPTPAPRPRPIKAKAKVESSPKTKSADKDAGKTKTTESSASAPTPPLFDIGT